MRLQSWFNPVMAGDYGLRARAASQFRRLNFGANPPSVHRQNAAVAVRCRKQKARNECEVIDKESELALVSCPVRGAVEGKSQKQHIGRRQERGFCEISAGEETRDKREFE